MARSIGWTLPARAEFLAALERLSKESPPAASTLYDAVEAAGQSLQEMPDGGRVVPELKLANRREIFVQSYRMVYRVEPDQVIILRLIHGRQDFRKAWKRPPT